MDNLLDMILEWTNANGSCVYTKMISKEIDNLEIKTSLGCLLIKIKIQKSCS